MTGKKILGILTLVIIVVLFFSALKYAGAFFGILVSPIGLIVLGLVLIVVIFLLFRFWKWCFN